MEVAAIDCHTVRIAAGQTRPGALDWLCFDPAVVDADEHLGRCTDDLEAAGIDIGAIRAVIVLVLPGELPSNDPSPDGPSGRLAARGVARSWMAYRTGSCEPTVYSHHRFLFSRFDLGCRSK